MFSALLCAVLVADPNYYLITSPSKPERERRDPLVAPFLKAAVGTEGIHSCSATICWHHEGTGYVLACGHCYRRVGESCKIKTYFVGNQREIRTFQGKVIARNGQEDLAVLTFRPDFEPHWIPIAPEDSPFFLPTKAPVGERVVVTGRDAGLASGDRRPAAYEAFIRRVTRDWYLESRQSQSRGGRSGGGVLTVNAASIIGVNHGREATVRGIGHGLWVPLHRIHKFCKANNLEFLLRLYDIPRNIPIRDWTYPQQSYPRNFIPLPYRRENLYVPLDAPFHTDRAYSRTNS